MIHYLTITRDHESPARVYANDDFRSRAPDHVRAVELTVEQHYGIHIYDDEDGRTWIQLREGGGWSAPIPPQDLVRAHLVRAAAPAPRQKMYKLLGPGDRIVESATPGTLGGNSKLKIYGRLDCWSARSAIPKGYEKVRVFFKDEPAAIAAGYRPCGHCLKDRYRVWAAGGEPRTEAYPWHTQPKGKAPTGSGDGDEA